MYTCGWPMLTYGRNQHNIVIILQLKKKKNHSLDLQPSGFSNNSSLELHLSRPSVKRHPGLGQTFYTFFSLNWSTWNYPPSNLCFSQEQQWLRNEEMVKYVFLLGAEVSSGERGLWFPLTVGILIETSLSFKYLLVIFKESFVNSNIGFSLELSFCFDRKLFNIQSSSFSFRDLSREVIFVLVEVFSK